MALIQEAISAVRNIRGEMNVPLDRRVDVRIQHSGAAARQTLEAAASAIQALAMAGDVSVAESVETPKFASTFVSGDMTLYVVLPPELVEQERQRLEKELAFAQKGLAGVEKKLANEKFVANAPAEVVEKEREKLDKLRADVEAMRERLGALG